MYIPLDAEYVRKKSVITKRISLGGSLVRRTESVNDFPPGGNQNYRAKIQM